MDALDVAILALRLALVLLLYLFLVAVLRFAARSMRPGVAPSAARPAATSLRLLVVENGASELAPGVVLTVPAGATLGRTERAHVVLADPTVSGEHARLDCAAGQWIVSDLGSTNGTLVNQQPVEREAPLGTGDVLSLGNVRLRVVGT